MPQIAIEYSAALADAFDARGLALSIHELLPPLVDAETANCKTRLIAWPETVVGAGGPEQAMVHVDIRILSGRSDAQKQALGAAVLEAARAALAKPEGMEVQLTVEVRELDRDHYHKLRL